MKSINNENVKSSNKLIASRWQRLGNFILDTIFSFITSYLAGFIIGFFVGIVKVILTVLHLIPLDYIINPVYYYFIGIFAVISYYTFPEKLWGMTVGKFITGTKVVSNDGEKLTFKQAFLRTVCRFIPFEIFSFFGNNGRPIGWHDALTKTQVISLRRNKK